MTAANPTVAQQPAPGLTIVVGLGATGLSCARFLSSQGQPFAVADSRTEPPGLEAFCREFPGVQVQLGAFDAGWLARATRLVVSPGVSPHEPALVAAASAGAELLGDIELFARHADAPVVAITGSNGKSTVTTLVGEMARRAGRAVQVGGNLGTPALDLLGERGPDLYVLELSSFQLELTRSLNARAAVVLNVSADHLDRHGDLAHYAAIKQRIYGGDGVMVVAADDPMVSAMAQEGREILRVTLAAPAATPDFGLLLHGGEEWLACGPERLMPASELAMAGRHNLSNALAALALGSAVGLPLAPMLETLRRFRGLPHRCRLVAERDGVRWYNDSKGTNVGATLAALAGMPGEKVVLIAGGLAKGQDFTPLRGPVAQRARAVVLIGRDAPLLEQGLGGAAPVFLAGNMEAAVAQAAAVAEQGDSVLLSPACASFDMFPGYGARGEAFESAVERLP